MSAVPEWAVPAVASGWSYFGKRPTDWWFPTIRRQMADGTCVAFFDDGSGSKVVDDMQGSELPFRHAETLPDSLKLADEYAESVGGWA